MMADKQQEVPKRSANWADMDADEDEEDHEIGLGAEEKKHLTPTEDATDASKQTGGAEGDKANAAYPR